MASDGGVHHDLMLPDMTHMMEFKYTNGTHKSLAAPPPKIQRLMVRMTYNQDAKTYAPLSHKP